MLRSFLGICSWIGMMLLSGFAQADTNFLTLGAGYEHLFSFPGAVIEPNEGGLPVTKADIARLKQANIKVSNKKILAAEVHPPHWIRLSGLQPGTAVLNIHTLDGIHHTYIVTVESPDKIPADPLKKVRKIGVGHDQIMDMPQNFLQGKSAPLVATVNPNILDIAPLSSTQIRIMGLSKGQTDLTLISANNQPTLYRVTVADAAELAPEDVKGQPQKIALEIPAGETKEMDLPKDFLQGEDQSSISSVLPEVVDVEVTQEMKLLLKAKAPGVSDVTLISAGSQATFYRITVTRAEKARQNVPLFRPQDVAQK